VAVIGGAGSVDTPSRLAGFDVSTPAKSVDTPLRLAGFELPSPIGGFRVLGARTAIPAAFGYRLAVSRSDLNRLLDVAQRPPEPAEREYLLLLVVAQDVHLGAGPRSRRVRQRPGFGLLRLAGFQVSLTGRFWVSPEALLARVRLGIRLDTRLHVRTGRDSPIPTGTNRTATCTITATA
jgi:hypothetical protein